MTVCRADSSACWCQAWWYTSQRAVKATALTHRRCLQDAPFFTVKLQIKVLPCLMFFRQGVALDRVVGFDDFGGKDDFSLAAVERRWALLILCAQAW